ncbi:MAG: 4'-phosphopantetheinyl transferase superfamily protein [Bacteroidales bacterium]|nr:4'-phosphopantetheinyl transferase superfamily protein [Clostridium sp.]MCM1204046.1 4'-phosphopantetheinyl transferase superfamily protein [Bacteroidales bacterium]
MNSGSGCSDEQSLVLYNLLVPERREKVKRIKNPEMKKRRILAGAFLQYGLSRTLGIPVEEISYSYGEGGKPMLSADTLKRTQRPFVDFNLSHSGSYVVLAVDDKCVGIDIEGKKGERLAVAKRCFCEEEYEDIIAGGTVEEQRRRFLHYWTCKEAYLKRSGEGLRMPLNSFRVVRREGLSYTEEGDAWFSVCYLENSEYCLSLCSEDRNKLEKIQAKTHRDSCLAAVTPQDIIAHMETGKY